jgi:transcriptional regulator with XRE-family HTH domain
MDKEKKMEIARNLARIRMEKGMTQEELAGLIDSNASYISQMENGGRGIGSKMLPKLCGALRITPNDLYGAAEKEKAPADTEALTAYEIETRRLMSQLPEDYQAEIVQAAQTQFLAWLKKKRERA